MHAGRPSVQFLSVFFCLLRYALCGVFDDYDVTMTTRDHLPALSGVFARVFDGYDGQQHVE